MNWERFFFYLQRFNAILLALTLIGFLGFIAYNSWVIHRFESDWSDPGSESSFGSDFEPKTSVIGQAIDAKGGEIVAYFDSNGDGERADKAGVSLVDPKSGKTMQLGLAPGEILADIDYLYDQGRKNERVIGYIAKVSDEERWRNGRADIVIGALPAMTRNVVARDVVFTDLPTVRSDGTLGVILWQTEDSAELVSFRLEDGSVIDRAEISLPAIRVNRLSQGPGLADDAALRRDPNFGKVPSNAYPY